MEKTIKFIFLILVIILVLYSHQYGKSPLDEFIDYGSKKINKDVFGYVYKQDFMDRTDYKILLEELKKYDQKLEKSWQNSKNVKRYNFVLDSPVIIQLIKKYENKIRHLTHNISIYLANNFPIEYRKYVEGSFMKKHRDVQIYKLPQYECVLTLSNSTDSFTDIEGRKIKAEPNSIIILKANGVEHEVTKVTHGERKFLKFIFTETDELA
jgi:hypothetical protein